VGKLHHPNIVRMFMWREDENTVFLVQEACLQGDLVDVARRFARRRIPEDKVSQMVGSLPTASLGLGRRRRGRCGGHLAGRGH